MSHYFNIPISVHAAVFVIDQLDRDLDIGTLTQKDNGRFLLTQTEDQFYECMDDARYYCDSNGPTAAPRHILSSARRLLRDLTKEDD